MTRKLVQVAAAVITRPDGTFLLGQRAPDTFYAGYWEFPGGKVEPGESPREALVRELEEELGITVDAAWPWIVREHEYEHAHVRLHFFEVPRWHGELSDRIHSALAWQHIGAVSVAPMLPANGPVLASLALPREYAITHAWQIGVAAQLAALDNALARGLRLIQVREAALPEDARRAFTREAIARAHAHGARVLVNDGIEAAASGADGVHLSAANLMRCTARPALPPGALLAASCHTREELEHAARIGCDFAVAGPVLPTPTHPEQPGIGWPAFAQLAHGLPMPVYALGGVTRADLDAARAANAHGIAGIRGCWT